MTQLDEVVSPENLARRVAEGYISQVDSGDGLRLWNYTAKAQAERVWDREMLICRGLVATTDGIIVARPFAKFFNVEEHATVPLEPFDVYEKLDGSLIVVANAPHGLSITSRGSFTSEHARAARELWTARYADVKIPDGETWCFELIAPWNRIVVDYGATEDLVLLAALDNATGRDRPWPAWLGPVARTFDLTDFDTVRARLTELGPNDEGYVLRFRESGLRMKAKGKEYLRLHRLVTGTSSRTIWETLRAGLSLDEVMERVPDEFLEWVRATASGLRAQYEAIESASRECLQAVADLPDRKAKALAIADYPYRGIVFRMLDGKTYDDVIWKMIEPEYERPFATRDDGAT